MKNLPHPDQHHLDAAEGWLGLGNQDEARAELQKIAPALKTHPFVLETDYNIEAKSGRWEKAAEAARGLKTQLPENPWGHFSLAFALHELKQTQEAYEVVKSVVAQFPDHQIMRYNLACYACQLGHLNEAMDWLKQAMKMKGKENVRQMALSDPDLEPLRKQIREI